MVNGWRFAMAAAIALREDYDGPMLRRLARASQDAKQTRRLLSLAVIYDGGRRSEAADLGGVTLQIIRDWVLRFNAEGPDGLIDRKAPGGQRKLNDEQRRALFEIVESGPIPAIHGVVRWRLNDLVQWIYDEFAITLKRDAMSRELKAMGFRKITARPRHYAQNELAVEAFKKVSRTSWQRSKPSSRKAAPWSSGGRMRPASDRRTS
jgi:transposase